MGHLVPFPRQKEIHWQGRPLTADEKEYMRQFLLSAARRVKMKRLRFSGVNFIGNDMKVIVDQLYEDRIILEEERKKVYRRLFEGSCR